MLKKKINKKESDGGPDFLKVGPAALKMRGEFSQAGK